MTIARAIGSRNLSAVPVIIAVIIICVASYFIMRRLRKPPSGHDT